MRERLQSEYNSERDRHQLTYAICFAINTGGGTKRLRGIGGKTNGVNFCDGGISEFE